MLLFLDNHYLPQQLPLPLAVVKKTALMAAMPEEKSNVLPPSKTEIASSKALHVSFPYRP